MKKNLFKGIWYAIILAAMVLFLQCSVPQPNDEIPITSNSDEAIDLFLEGREMSENLKTAEAAELFDRAIVLDPDFAKAYYYRAYSGGGYKVYRENLSKSADLVDKVSEGEKHLILYGIANADNDGVKQESELNELLKLFPNDKRVQNLAGLYYYYNEQNYAKSMEYLNNAINLDSNFAPCYNTLGYLYCDMGNNTDAEKAFRKYITLIPDEANPYDSYAEFLLRRGKYDESITQYEKAYRTDPKFVTALAGVADNYIFMGKFDKAREYYQKYYDEALNINQKMGALYLKATSYMHEGETEKTLLTFDERAELAEINESPNYVISSYFSSAYTLDEIGKLKEAEVYYDKSQDFIKSAELKETDRVSYQLDLDLNLCYHNILKGELEKAKSALAICSETVEKRGNTPEKQFLNLIMGLLEVEKENYQKALEYYAGADRKSPYIWYHEAIALEKSKNIDDAKKLYLKVANCNDNGFDLALVRNKAKEKAIVL